MKNAHETIQKILELAGFKDFNIQADSENRRLAVFVNEGEWFKKVLPNFVSDIDYIVRLATKRDDTGGVFVDINNYRREREDIILELARAAARKAAMSKSDVELPPMNGYERRLVHVELATNPNVKTESIGEAKQRRVIVKPSGL
ncbi:MAG: hypothetical protein A3I24_03690 [Candidatus Harrisonbacteria bacterium RIFCSPLOWO2_02_FULL_41_13b]|uniref:R3H domain-containing protein n=1 Tax=Candidatus Harrisonbacteria bacterium RIFCSPLOWO2_02_FULL_41_13b TaxID=1798409 RepID=A0A1G1ZRU5_9BACT|nr:MAG: hypothetical protein A3I24_03690 [Candidatus Harrisonbacteria bacterium RIFCSPLOWO2_02_FULL_41_13b]